MFTLVLNSMGSDEEKTICSLRNDHFLTPYFPRDQLAAYLLLELAQALVSLQRPVQALPVFQRASKQVPFLFFFCAVIPLHSYQTPS